MVRLCYPFLTLVSTALSTSRYIEREQSYAPAFSFPGRICRAASSWASPWDLQGFTPYSYQSAGDLTSASPVNVAHSERAFEEGFQQVKGASALTFQKRDGGGIDYTKRE